MGILHQRRVAALGRTAEAATKQAVEHHIGRAEFGQIKVAHHLGEIYSAKSHKPVTVGGARRDQMRGLGVEQIHLGAVALLIQQARHRQGVATIVAWAGKHHYALRLAPARHYFAAHLLGGPLHEVERGYVFGIYGCLIDFLYSTGNEYLHT